jgi:hypothetical protein
VLLGLRPEPQFIDMVYDLTKVVAAGDLVVDLAEDLTYFVFNRVRPAGLLFESMQVGKELLVDEVTEVVAGNGLVMVDFAVLSPGSGPLVPAVGLVEDEVVFLALQRRLGRLVLFQPIEVFKRNKSQEVCSV